MICLVVRNYRENCYFAKLTEGIFHIITDISEMCLVIITQNVFFNWTDNRYKWGKYWR